MKKEELKEELLKKNYDAHFYGILCGKAYYRVFLNGYSKQVFFIVPIREMGNDPFMDHMKAKHLIRWMVDDVPKLSHFKHKD